VTAAHVHTLDLYRYHHGELDPARAEQIRTAIDRDPELRRRYQAILAEQAAIVAEPLPPAIAALATDGTAARRPSWGRSRWLLPGLLGGLTLAAAALLVVPLEPAAPPVAPDHIRVKGDLPDLEVWVGTPAGPRPLRIGEPVRAGDTVQLAAHPHGASFVSFAGQDGTGEFEIYGTVRAVDGDSLLVAPHALVLDDAPGPQRFFALAHDAPASEAELRAALADGAPSWASVELRKE